MNRRRFSALVSLVLNGVVLWAAVDGLQGFQKWFVVVLCGVAVLSNLAPLVREEAGR